MLIANDPYRSKLLEQVRISTERLSKLRNGTSLSNALEQQGPEVKRRFMDSRRLSNDHVSGTAGRHVSMVKEPVEEALEPSEILEYVANSRASPETIMNNRASFRLFPELEQQLPKNKPGQSTARDEKLEAILIKVQSLNKQSASKSVPRLRGFSIEGMQKRPSAPDLNKDIMARILREEHETAISKLKELQAQQKLQAVADIEDGDKKKSKGQDIDNEQDSPGKRAKNSFKYNPADMLRSDNNNSETEVMLRPGIGQYGIGSVLKFRRELTPERVYPNLKRIAQNLKTYRLGQVVEVTTLHDIPKQREGQKIKENKRDKKYESFDRSPKRVQIRFVSSSAVRSDDVQRETIEAVALMNRNISAMIPKTKNSVDYSMKIMHENLEFLEKERGITQKKLTLRSKDDQKSRRINEKKIQYKKWPLASNSQSLNDSVQGSDCIDQRQLSYCVRGSNHSIGDTTLLIKKYEQYESERRNQMTLALQESSLKHKLEKLIAPNELINNASNKPPYLSKDITTLSSNTDLKPKLQRSMSQV